MTQIVRVIRVLDKLVVTGGKHWVVKEESFSFYVGNNVCAILNLQYLLLLAYAKSLNDTAQLHF